MSIKERIKLEYHKLMLSLKMRQIARESVKSMEIIKDFNGNNCNIDNDMVE